MRRNSWEINRIGLINFWYYDNEVFDFIDGRLLLRGNNGAGKSLTMQSFIPLLLDGNLRPERLDPFGSRDKKIKNYLLEENDTRNERTGYLYMEFKRKNIDEYITIGLGLQAKVNQNITSWYFILKGGKRVGVDFPLYKESKGEKISLSKIELRNRLENCDELIESSSLYLKRINNLFFGFETEEEYKELLELLIQIRSPKLSNSFKPTRITEILNNSLSTLSNEDLHVLSETIKKMDQLKVNIQDLSSKIISGEKIQKVFNSYNEEIIRERIQDFIIVLKEFEEIENKIKISEKNIEKLNREIDVLEVTLSQLENEFQNIQKEKISLEKNDVTKLKEEFEFLKNDLEKNGNIVTEKNETLEKVKNNLKQKNISLQEIEKQIDSLNYKINILLKDMEAEINVEEFPECLILKDEFLVNKNIDFDFSFHQNEIKNYTSNLEKALEILQEYQQLKNIYSLSLELLDSKESDLKFIKKNIEKYENYASEIKEELIQKIYTWEEKNEILKISKPILEELITKIYNFSSTYQFEDIKSQILPTYETLEKKLNLSKYEIENNCNILENNLDKLKIRLEDLENTKEIEPEKSQQTIDNRIKLKNMNIPFIEFYKCVDFPDNIPQQKRDHIEEALFNMGILDALVVDPQYKEKILEFEEGICDKYIFSTAEKIKIVFENMINNNDKQLNFENTIYIGEKGNYKIGIIEGTISKTYLNYFIGIEARKEFREKKIRALKDEITVYSKNLEAEREKYSDILKTLSKLENEKKNFPKGDDISVAFEMLNKSEMEYDVANKDFEKQKEITEQNKRKKEIKGNEVSLLCTKLHLSSRLEDVSASFSAIKEYNLLFNELKNIHVKYVNSLSNKKASIEDIENLENMIESISIDIKRIEKEKNKILLRIQSIEEQMNMRDYIQIKERLDYCIKRFNEIPNERITIVKKNENLILQKSNSEENLNDSYRNKNYLEKKLAFVRERLIEEAELNYSVHSKNILENIENLKEISMNILETIIKNKSKNEIESNLHAVFHENKNTLTIYKISLDTIFKENNDNIYNISTERFDIKCKLNGNTLTFDNFLENLKNYLEEMKALFTQSDEELFKEILSNTISKKIKYLISQGKEWIKKMNLIMKETDSGSGISFSLDWKNKTGNTEEELDSNQLVNLLSLDVQVMKESDFQKLSNHFRSKINEAKTRYQSSFNALTFEQIIKEVLDYRQWFQFQIYYQKTGEKKEVLTDSRFSTFSGGEKAMAMYIPLFAAAAAKYKGANEDAPKIMALDEAFAGIDNENVEKLLNMMVTLDFNFILTSQALLGAYNSLPGLSIYQLTRFNNNKFVTTFRLIWDGKKLEKFLDVGDVNGEE